MKERNKPMTKRVQKINDCDFGDLDNIPFTDLENVDFSVLDNISFINLENIDFSGMNKMLDELDFTADDLKRLEELQKEMSDIYFDIR